MKNAFYLQLAQSVRDKAKAARVAALEEAEAVCRKVWEERNFDPAAAACEQAIVALKAAVPK